MTAQHKLIKARTQLVLDAPFFGSLALRLMLKEDKSTPTAYTDGTVLGYSPAFIQSLSLAQVKALVAHEVMHLACLHHTRRRSRDPTKWNMAADYAINGILAETGFTLPQGVLLDARYDNQCAEAIYRQLPDDSGERNYTDLGQVRDAPAFSGSNAAAMETQWKVAAAQAVQQARAMGNLPGRIRRLVDDILHPQVDWRTLLRHFVEQSARNDYSWLAPSRRYLAQGLCLPGLHSKELGKIVIAIDTSGSIDAVALNQFAAEVSGILEEYDTRIHVVYCDTEIQGVEAFERFDLPLKLTPVGGGGTDFRPVFEWVEEKTAPSCLVYLTDLECHRFPKSAPDYPVLWVQTGSYGRKVPFGEIIKMNERR